MSTPPIQATSNTVTVGAALAEAVRHHRAGRLQQAEARYKQTLYADPDHADALNLLGVVMHQMGRPEAAVELIGKAVALEPEFTEAHSNLGNALRDLGRLDEAVASYRKAIALNPDHAEAHSNLGNTLEEQGRLDEAAAACRRAISLKPDYAEAHHNLGNALRELGRLDEAAAAHRRAIALKPDYAEAHHNLGVALLHQGNFAEAVAACREAVALKPEFAETHCNLGIALVGQGKADEAVGDFTTAERLGPGGGKNVAAFRYSLLDKDRAHKGEPYVKHLKDVLVDTAYWSILDGDKIYCRETNDRKLANNPIIEVHRVPGRTKFIAIYPDPEVVIEERCVFVGGDATYSHWILRNLMKLSIIEHDKDLRSLPLLLNADLAPWQSETLELLGIPRDRRILVNRNSIVKCNDIYVPTLLRNHPKMKMGLDWLRHKFLTGRETPSRESRDRIFVSRRDAYRRHIVNEEDLADRLAEFGFRVVVPGQMSFSEQVKTFSNAGIVVGAHGAGLLNIVFAPLDCRMIEITSTEIEFMGSFRQICHELGQEVVSLVYDSLVPPPGGAAMEISPPPHHRSRNRERGRSRDPASTDTLVMHSDFRVNVEEVVSVVTEIIADSSA